LIVFRSFWQVSGNSMYLMLTQLRQNFFSNRVVNLWKNLPEEVASSINCFKGWFDKYFADNRCSMGWWNGTNSSTKIG